MCGIIGVLGNHQASPILVEGLKRLEYRGYDSAGIATVNGGRLERRRALGKLANLSDALVHDPLRGTAGIGHTRWATHGAATTVNAHPHQRGRVAVVHNGIIENYRALRARLAAHQLTPETDTDTETVAMLCDWHMSQGLSPIEAAKATVSELEGAYALCFLFEGEDDLIVAARKGSPLAVGWGKGEMFVGSDALALAPMTNEITYLEEGDIAIVTRAGATFLNAAQQPVSRPRRTVDLDSAIADKAGHRHYMSKEIAEQPDVLANALEYYAGDNEGGQMLEAGVDFSAFDRVVMVACGTASLACLVSKYWVEQIAQMPVDVDIASEFRYREAPLDARTLAVFVSQSGETADTLAALRYATGKAGKVVSVVNALESSIARESDLALPILAGPEIGVASTKAFTCQLAVLASLALQAGRQRGTIDPAQQRLLTDQLRQVPGQVAQALAIAPQIKAVSAQLARYDHVLFLGRGALYPLALEGALKLKEISYIHAEGYASGELKHGPIALIDEEMPVVVLAPHDGMFDKTVSNMQEVMARGGKIVMISDGPGLKDGGDGAWQKVEMPTIDGPFAAIAYAVPVQELAYFTAVEKGTDVDQPRNLAKSVTVE
ncbi:glutamine--fructose-6-phosphate transaminase (isomerizing) [Lutimaribacter sp. EGI FJ00015]|uniref:Glutamine--fructose-6-phosphate transaminase (Isomerizing) n=1 Tax=Lutimaribacter degradans TaxID=2945989 RepID=A0ACC6A2N3_9RHOB|nr:glutamine--fructose-6-phosphate transaminase (isomerizing) [Lutimaribacter sp. EGI FJ00013]MCM2563849.1 glutamine--fructose-6-phosphate transaminase (isomerizing) [Lutimaribacter sp. EGI FJ00013]MCO0615052.1 glutamine--fructose-6-phosphate transaminase (isomerizing) [Lutimaribacter sp. EGI FJ00015]MCO0637724.1 glutamine--fructose-6-phosphate transaminase (isomerizing) [Lutimaribacter sp. EGI FJ00014]